MKLATAPQMTPAFNSTLDGENVLAHSGEPAANIHQVYRSSIGHFITELGRFGEPST